MKRIPQSASLSMMVTLMALSTSGCQLQVVIEEGLLQNWFWSRLIWAAVITAILGIIAARLLCQLPIRATLLDCIKLARARFTMWVTILTLFLAPLLLWLDAFLTQPFGEDNQLSPWSVFLLVTLDWRTLALMFSSAAVFYLTVAVFTRAFFGRNCNCKYAFIPKAGS